MAITQQDILEKLQAIKARDRTSLFSPEDYRKFMPSALPNNVASADTGLYTARLQSVMDRSNAATLTEQVKGQNRRDYNQMLKAQQSLARAQKAMGSAKNANYGNLTKKGPNYHFKVNQRQGSASATAAMSAGGRLPVGKPRGVAVGNVKQFKWNGRNLWLNPSVGKRFVGFLNALSGTGYKIQSIGTYANRNIAGSNTKSLHAYGLAMDINPGANPVSYGHVVTNLPKGVGRLAAKYGLAWGGAWHGSKKDAMHFSVPYFGTK